MILEVDNNIRQQALYQLLSCSVLRESANTITGEAVFITTPDPGFLQVWVIFHQPGMHSMACQCQILVSYISVANIGGLSTQCSVLIHMCSLPSEFSKKLQVVFYTTSFQSLLLLGHFNKCMSLLQLVLSVFHNKIDIVKSWPEMSMRPGLELTSKGNFCSLSSQWDVGEPFKKDLFRLKMAMFRGIILIWCCMITWKWVGVVC